MQMNRYYWSIENWIDNAPPINAEEIIEIANRKIDAFINNHCIDHEREIRWYSDGLWEDFCLTDEIDGVTAIYK
jgi:hypothetical protein